MASEADICNRALNLIGAKRINALSDSTENARACNDIYDQVRDQILEEQDWSFASIRQELSADPTAPTGDDYNYRYNLPTSPKCIVVRGIVNNEGADYQIEGDFLLTNETSVTIRYTAQITDTSKFTEGFIAALAGRLALELSYKLKGSGGTFDRMGRVSAVYDRRGKGKDSRQMRPKTYGESERTPWTSAGR